MLVTIGTKCSVVFFLKERQSKNDMFLKMGGNLMLLDLNVCFRNKVFFRFV